MARAKGKVSRPGSQVEKVGNFKELATNAESMVIALPTVEAVV
jgi:hypothetical protein